jgi:hypothetical protein
MVSKSPYRKQKGVSKIKKRGLRKSPYSEQKGVSKREEGSAKVNSVE